MSTFREIALRNAARGFRVHPLNGKVPILENWPDLATTDRTDIDKIAAEHPHANCGVAVGSDLCVLESDDRAKLEDLLGDEIIFIPHTYTVQARDNRPHFYFKPTAKSLQTGNKTLAGIFEFKQHRLQVVAEGSTHPTGAIYEIIDNLPIVPIPDALVDALVKLHNDGTKQKKDAIQTGQPITEDRNVTLTSIAGKWRNDGMTPDGLYVALSQYNVDYCQPPLPDAEVRHIADQIGRKPLPEKAGEVVIGEQKEPEAPKDWRELFHTFDEVENAPPPTFLIKDFMQREGVTGLAAPVRERKTIVALNVTHALITGEKLFGYFDVENKPQRVLYLCPEMGLSQFAKRIKGLGLMPHVGKNLFIRTLSKDGKLPITDKALIPALPGSVVIMDTAIRFMTGSEKDADDMRVFADEVLGLIKNGAESVLMLHHTPKETSTVDTLTLENALRGSGDIGAFLSACWGTRLQNLQDPYHSDSFLTNLKQRDFETKDFEVTCDENCLMRMKGDPEVDAAKLAPRAKKGNRDGRDAEAIVMLKEHPKASEREMVEMLKNVGIKRGKTWVHDKRYELMQENGGQM